MRKLINRHGEPERLYCISPFLSVFKVCWVVQYQSIWLHVSQLNGEKQTCTLNLKEVIPKRPFDMNPLQVNTVEKNNTVNKNIYITLPIHLDLSPSHPKSNKGFGKSPWWHRSFVQVTSKSLISIPRLQANFPHDWRWLAAAFAVPYRPLSFLSASSFST